MTMSRWHDVEMGGHSAWDQVIEEMLNEGFDINSPIEEEAGETFLHYAARFRVLSMVIG